MIFPRRIVAAVAAAFAVAGCASDLTSAASPEVVAAELSGGAYTLVSINSRALPVEVRNDATLRVSINAGELSFTGNQFTQQLTIWETVPGNVSTPRQSVTRGTVSVSGARIHFRASDGGEWDGVLGNRRLDYAVPANNGTLNFSFTR